MHVHVIANPVSGTGRTWSRLERLVRTLRTSGHRVSCRTTRKRRDASRYARDLPDSTDAIVIAGGDGTIHECINGLKEPHRVPIAVLPCGGANLLAKDLDLPLDAEDVARMIEAGKTVAVDLARVNGTKRLCMLASAGFDAAVIRAMQEARNGTGGYRKYPRAILSAYRRYKAHELTVQVDQHEPVTGRLAIVANTSTYAGFLTAADTARVDSGHLDILVFPRCGVLSYLRYGWAGLFGRVSRLKGVQYLTGGTISLASNQPVEVEVDGEYFGETPVKIAIESQKATFLVP